jgi:integrase/recombinase XerC
VRLLGVDIDDVCQRDIEKSVIAQPEEHSVGTVLTRFRSLRVCFNWARDEQIIDASPMARKKEPKADQPPPGVPSEDEVRRLLKSLGGKSFNDRDLALLRFSIDAGCRIGEVVRLRDVDLDFGSGVAVVYGKGRKARIVPFGNRTAQALLAYRRERRKHRCADLPEVFLGHAVL